MIITKLVHSLPDINRNTSLLALNPDAKSKFLGLALYLTRVDSVMKRNAGSDFSTSRPATSRSVPLMKPPVWKLDTSEPGVSSEFRVPNSVAGNS